MDLKDFKQRWIELLDAEIKDYHDAKEHDLDFTIAYKDFAYRNYIQLREEIEKL